MILGEKKKKVWLLGEKKYLYNTKKYKSLYHSFALRIV